MGLLRYLDQARCTVGGLTAQICAETNSEHSFNRFSGVTDDGARGGVVRRSVSGESRSWWIVPVSVIPGAGT